MPKRFLLSSILILCGLFLWRSDFFVPAEGTILSPGSVSIEPKVRVITTDVAITNNDIRFNVVGTGRARMSVEIYPSVSEEVSEVLFHAGQKVRQGELLVQLDDRAEKLALKLAEVKLKEAKDLLTRYERAVKDGAVPESEVDSARASVDSAKVALEQAELELLERKVLAPFDGFVGIPRIDPGERINSNTLITGLDQRDILLLDFEVPETLAGALKVGHRISASTPAFPGREFDGKISALESRVDPSARTIRTRAEIENSEDLLRTGMSFSLTINIPGPPLPTLPEIALQWGNYGSYVWSVENERAKQIPVRVVSRSAGTVLLEGELPEGKAVVVEGLQRLEPGRLVAVLGSTPNPAAAVLQNTEYSEKNL